MRLILRIRKIDICLGIFTRQSCKNYRNQRGNKRSFATLCVRLGKVIEEEAGVVNTVGEGAESTCLYGTELLGFAACN
jgi:hypothetical protein